MGAPTKDMKPADDSSAEALLTSLQTIDPAERRKHALVFNYWLSIRGKRQFPAIRDLDPLEISDAGPYSLLMEMIGSGEDAEIRHFGHAIKQGADVQRISDAEPSSLLSCIHAKLPVVAASMQAFAFEDRFESLDGPKRCWVTLLPLSASGTWIDFVYGFVSIEDSTNEAEQAGSARAPVSSADEAAEPFKVELRPYDDASASQEAIGDAGTSPEVAPDHTVEDEPVAEFEPELVAELEPVAEQAEEPISDPDPEPPVEAGFSSKLLAGLASVGGFYGKVTKAEPAPPQPEPEPEPEPEWVDEQTDAPEAIEEPEQFAEPEPEVAFEAEPEVEPAPEPEPEPEAIVEDVEDEPEPQPEQQQPTARPVAMEASLQEKLSGVRAMAEEARQAQERSNMALYEGLGAAYDFALDAEEQPEDYLRLVENQGLKIQLRSPMKPVVKLAFAGLTDDTTIGQLEAVLTWALKADLPRGSLAERIVAEGGIGRILENKPH